MKWQNLKNNKCPQCNRDFTKGLNVESNMRPAMLTHSCGFKISEQRYKEIVSDMVEKKIETNGLKADMLILDEKHWCTENCPICHNGLSRCCNSPLVGGVQCENCGSDGQ